MRRAAFVALVGFAALSSRASAEDEKKPAIAWEESLDAAKKAAAADGRPVIGFFTFDTCAWCHKLEAETFTDADVIAKSAAFHWVTVNRDRTPEITTRLNVSAYPTLLTFGAKDEKIHRFSGFCRPKEFLASLDEALRRFALYKAGKPWDDPGARPASICDEATVETMKAPTEDVPAGLTVMGGELWIAQAGKLRRVDLASAEVKATFEIAEAVLDLTNDGKLLYGVEYGWTAGLPIHVVDPATGKTVRDIVTEANKTVKSYGAKGVAWRDGKLYVLSGMEGVIHELDPADGKVVRDIQTPERWLAGLDFDGKSFVTGSKDALLFLDPETGAITRRVKTNYPLRSIATAPSAIYLMEQPVFDFDKDNKPIRLWPKETLVHKLTLK